jgi:hypothetical protein
MMVVSSAVRVVVAGVVLGVASGCGGLEDVGREMRDADRNSAEPTGAVPVGTTRQGVIYYWGDDRKDRYEFDGVAQASIVRNFGRTVKFLHPDMVIDNGDGWSTIRTQTAGQAFGLCSDERYVSQPVSAAAYRDGNMAIGSKCTGILVAPSLVLTANHCAASGQRVIFGYHALSSTTSRTKFSNASEVFTAVGLLASSPDFDSGGSDWALLELDRAVPASTATPVALARTSGKIPDGQNV